MSDVKEMINAVNSLLHANEPGNISVDDHTGNTGYKPQAIIDAMFEVFPVGAWGFEEISNEVLAGDKGGLAIAQVRVWLEGVKFQPTAYGQSRVTRGDVGDAKKGAQTDAMKKALSYFTVGNRAYHGLLVAPSKGQQQQRPQAQQTRQTQQPMQSPVKTQQDAPSVTSVRKMALELYPSKSFADIYTHVTKRAYVSDDAISPDETIAIKESLDSVRAKRAAAPVQLVK